MRAALVLLTLVAGCATTGEPRPVEVAPRQGHFQTPSEGFELDWSREGGVSLQDVVDEFTRVTGLLVLVDEDSMERMSGRAARLNVVTASPTIFVPPERVYPFVEGILSAHQFVLIDVHHDEPRTVRLVSIETQHRGRLRREALFVPIERIGAYAEHPAMLVSTLVPLAEGVDPRTVSNSLRTMLTDLNTQSIVPAGRALELTGFGPDVCALAGILRDVGGR